MAKTHVKISCSFCGKSQADVRKMIAGPSVSICDECIALCNDIIAKEHARHEGEPHSAARQSLPMPPAPATWRLELRNCEVRSFSGDDVPSLARQANNPAIGRNLRDGFPHPYREEHALAFIARARSRVPQTDFAIAVTGSAVGCVGFRLGQDIDRVSAELGYWLGEEYWGRGITTEVVQAVVPYAIEQFPLTRVFALPFEWNAASCRVLEKAGFVLEARLRRCAVKEDRVVDQFLYGFVPG